MVGGKSNAVWPSPETEPSCVGSSSIPTPTLTISPQAQWALLGCTVPSSDSFSVCAPAYHSRSNSLGNFSKNAGTHQISINLTLPPQSSPDHIPTLVYRARVHLALNNPSAALSLPPTDSEDVTTNAISLARYIAATIPSSSKSFQGAEAALEGAYGFEMI